MIDKRAQQKATSAVRIARDISDESQHSGKKRLEIPVMEGPEFWAGIGLLLSGEWKRLHSDDPTVIVLERG